jgi:hypothetical protein
MMGRVFRLAALVPMALLIPAFAADVDNDAAKEAAIAKYRAKVIAAPFFYAKLTAIDADGDEKKLTVQIPYKGRITNPDGQKKYQEVAKRYREAVAKRDAAEAQRVYAELSEAYMGAYEVIETEIDFQLVATKDLLVRKPTLPLKEPGDDGIVRPYTNKELAQLKGGATLPGWAGTIMDLEQDSYVAVYIDRTKYKPAPTKTAKDKEKAGETGKSDEPIVYPIRMIAILPPQAAIGLGGNPFAPGANPFGK